MTTLSIETREKYSIEIEEELYNKYLNGELTKEEVLDKTGDEIWDCNQWEEEKEERYNEAMKNLSNIFQSKPKPVRRIKMPSRNDKCPCGSGKKYKNCCMDIDMALIEKYDKGREIQSI